VTTGLYKVNVQASGSSSCAEARQLFPGHTPLEATPNVYNDPALAHVDSTLAAVWLMTGVIKSQQSAVSLL
jgi:hypothetical protein